MAHGNGDDFFEKRRDVPAGWASARGGAAALDALLCKASGLRPIEKVSMSGHAVIDKRDQRL